MAADLDAVRSIERRSFSEPWSREAFRYFLGADGFLAVIEADGSDRPAQTTLEGIVRGYAVTTRASDDRDRVAHVRNIAVDPAVRREGLGRHLLVASLRPYLEADLELARLEVRASNAPAIALYRRHGFRVTTRQPAYYEDGEAALVMETPLDDVLATVE